MANKKRITVMIDESTDKKVRLLQAKKIQQEQSSYSYSRVVQECLEQALS